MQVTSTKATVFTVTFEPNLIEPNLIEPDLKRFKQLQMLEGHLQRLIPSECSCYLPTKPLYNM